MERLYKIVAVVAVIAAAGVTAYNNAQNDELQMSSLAMENVEAIARDESGNFECIPPYEKYTCVYIGTIRLHGIKYNL